MPLALLADGLLPGAEGRGGIGERDLVIAWTLDIDISVAVLNECLWMSYPWKVPARMSRSLLFSLVRPAWNSRL